MAMGEDFISKKSCKNTEKSDWIRWRANSGPRAFCLTPLP